MRHLLLALPLLLMQPPIASAQVSLELGISLPGVSIGINLPAYPEMQRVPGYPVYYAPQARANFFFYDGLYWVYQDDDWYASDWYDGPWGRVSPAAVPLFVLRVPVRYYRSPPTYFSGWRGDAPPRWGEHWGNDWQRQRRGWDRWDRRAVPAPAPLPHYQRPYAAERYPRPDQQRDLRERHYHYQPREAVPRQHLQVQRAEPAPARQWPHESLDDRPHARPMPAPERRHDRRPDRAPEPQGKGQQQPPARQELGKPGQGRKEHGKGRDNADERDNDRRK